MAPGNLGLFPKGAQQAADLRQHVGDADEVGVRGGDAAQRPLLAAAMLGHPGRLLDVGPDLDRVGGEHLVEVALADDRVLLPPDPAVGQHLPDVEQPAGQPVEAVLGLARSEQGPGDRDLAELEGQVAGGVVDGEADLGHGERRAALRAGKDEVLHPPAAQRPGTLLAEDPRDGVDDVGLARAVGADDDADPRLEDKRGLVRKGLEPTQRQ